MFTPKTSRSAFTLVELLTVIAIIAVLMGILFPTIGAAIESAKKTQAKNDELQIVNAVKAYYTEYGKYPTASTSDTEVADTGPLLSELRIPSGFTPTMNPRKIVFLEVPDAKNYGQANKEKSGISKLSGKWLDPWGNPYKVMLDADYDNKLANPYSQNAGNPGTPPNGGLSTGVIAWSLGRDGKGGTGDKTTGDAKDDVISWQ